MLSSKTHVFWLRSLICFPSYFSLQLLFCTPALSLIYSLILCLSRLCLIVQGCSQNSLRIPTTTAIAKGRKSSSLLGALQTFFTLLSSPPQAVLQCPTPAPLPLQAVDIDSSTMPCSYLTIFLPLLMPLCPPWLFLDTQSLGLIQSPSG